MFEFLKTWLLYPAAATIHGLQGVLCGLLAARAIIKKETSDAICALLIAIGFFTYEIMEQTKINDNAYLDIEAMWVMAVFSGIIYTGLHFIGKWRKKIE